MFRLEWHKKKLKREERNDQEENKNYMSLLCWITSFDECWKDSIICFDTRVIDEKNQQRIWNLLNQVQHQIQNSMYSFALDLFKVAELEFSKKYIKNQKKTWHADLKPGCSVIVNKDLSLFYWKFLGTPSEDVQKTFENFGITTLSRCLQFKHEAEYNKLLLD
jgi:hypothetical protein